MRYRLTCLTPVLVGDGRRLSPIDYMVWKDQVNVLDQQRIFKLLAKGPRLEGYLTQIKKADKLDFASWGGFAQNFAGRRIPFEHASAAAQWQKASGDALHIPTFASAASGPYLPATAIKGALRTGMVFANVKGGALPGAEQRALGHPGVDRMRSIAAGDSAPAAAAAFKVYHLRTSTLQKRPPDSYTLAWKQSVFAEMAAPGAVFEGDWQERPFLSQPETRRAMNWPDRLNRSSIFAAANAFAARLLEAEKQYAAWTGLDALARSVAELEARRAAADKAHSCLIALGRGSGFLSKTAWPDTSNPELRAALRQLPEYERAINSGLPFPKTRRVVYLDDQPAALAGWALLEVDSAP